MGNSQLLYDKTVIKKFRGFKRALRYHFGESQLSSERQDLRKEIIASHFCYSHQNYRLKLADAAGHKTIEFRSLGIKGIEQQLVTSQDIT